MNYLLPAQWETVHAWWRALQPAETARPGEAARDCSSLGLFYDRGHRARLRRAQTLAELEGESACFDLRARLGQLKSPWLSENEAEWLFLVAGAVALVKDNTPENPTRTLAFGLGRSAGDKGAEPMKEMRFRRLLREGDPEAFYLQLRRALQLAVGKVNVARLADDLIGWTAERTVPQKPSEAMHYRWARDYFLTRKDQNQAKKNNEIASSDPEETGA